MWPLRYVQDPSIFHWLYFAIMSEHVAVDLASSTPIPRPPYFPCIVYFTRGFQYLVIILLWVHYFPIFRTIPKIAHNLLQLIEFCKIGSFLTLSFFILHIL